jgi:DNA-binding NarL/FixJ family response regulator
VTRVAVVDDQTLVRQGIRSLLALSDEIDVVAEASDGDEALGVLEAHDVDVLLLDCACLAATASPRSRRFGRGATPSP